ncbi:phosphate-selective porin OprO and OprP [Sphingomonas sp. NFR04]|uniref:OprO/OprP family phosphate-selective porin n=1 Tax=Sphingomonas sp. NFR04 TaxID=1566283 RepID=UPI0008EC8256|nr:porin [Sphingomonas sp. NFR04]SFK25949.1 phosphate-selective porin OprO and OprP [Sphingomonas sp. NFR04]
MKMKFLAGAALSALLFATPALAQSTPGDQAELVKLLKAQAEEIAALRARLDKIEGNQAAAPVAHAAAPISVPQAARAKRTNVANDETVADSFAPQLAPVGLADQSVAQARATANVSNVTTEWRGGLPIFRSADGKYLFKMRGRIINHVSSTFGSNYDARNITTTGARALRIGIEGAVGPHFFYQFENDFADNTSDVGTMFVGWRNDVGKVSYDVRFGNMFNDRSFEGSSGSDAPPFLERNVVATSIIPQRGFYGIALMPRLFWKTGHASVTISGDSVDASQAINDSRTVLARAHWNPFKTDRSIVHVGLWGFDEALSSRGPGTLTRNTVIGGRFNGNLRVQTGTLVGGTGTTGYGAELGGYAGPFWVMGEAGKRVARLNAGRPDFESKAWSLSTGFFVTGDLPPYNPRLGTFAQPRVLRPVFDGGPGAIEVLARYESIDYSGIPNATKGNAATIGTNWYLDSIIRLQLNLIHWNTSNRAGSYTGKDKGETISAGFGVTF